MAKRKRIAALVLAVLVLCALLVSECFLAAESDHDCTGDNCAVCCVLNACQSVLRTLGAALMLAAVCALAVRLCARAAYCAEAACAAVTPVSLKVKLSN